VKYNPNRSDSMSVACIVAIYAIFSSLWIYLSDSILGLLAKDIATITSLSKIKGTAFVILTSLLLYRLISRYVKTVRDAEGRILGLNEALEKSNAELDAERAHWKAAIEAIADEVWIADAQGRMSQVNLPAAAAAEADDFIDGTSAETHREVEFLDPDGKRRSPADAPLLQSLSGKIVRGEEILLHGRTGTRRYRQFSSAPMRDAVGAITGAVAIVRDITDHKQAEQALKRLLARTEFLFDASVKITGQSGLESLMTTVAQAARELVAARHCVAGHGYLNGRFRVGGASHSEGAEPCPPGQVFNFERGGIFMDLVEKCESFRFTDAEMRGHHRWWGLPADHVPLCGLLGSRFIDFQGRPDGVILVSDKEDGSGFTAEDEAALRQLAIISSLALQHIESNESLLRAMEAAEAANRTKSQFLANMSHELRTPMAGVLGMLDLALGGTLEKGQREFIQTAHDSAGSLVRVLNDILEMTRIRSGMLRIESKPFSPRKCVAGVVDIFIAEAKRKGLVLILSMSDQVPRTVIGDQLQLRQVLTNLAANAVKFTDRGKVELKVESVEGPSAENWEFTFTVTDTGIGIPNDKKALIFRPFSQVDDSHTRKYGGAGLGLAISKEIVEHMGGMLAFDGNEGGGCRFWFTITLGKTGGSAIHPAGAANPREAK
jgi:signal transduction histidine kinase/PAS domain-containing protein